MRVLVLLVLVACDLQPPKPREQPKAPVADAAVIAVTKPDAATAEPPPAIVDAGVAVVTGDGDIEPTTECLEVAIDIADKMIANAKEPSEKAAFEQDRAKLIKTASRNCTKFNWSEAARKCFLSARTREQIDACAKDLPTPDSGAPTPPAPPPEPTIRMPGRGSGGPR